MTTPSHCTPGNFQKACMPFVANDPHKAKLCSLCVNMTGEHRDCSQGINDAERDIQKGTSTEKTMFNCTTVKGTTGYKYGCYLQTFSQDMKNFCGHKYKDKEGKTQTMSFVCPTVCDTVYPNQPGKASQCKQTASRVFQANLGPQGQCQSEPLSCTNLLYQGKCGSDSQKAMEQCLPSEVGCSVANMTALNLCQWEPAVTCGQFK
jgi:hypothetical protein